MNSAANILFSDIRAGLLLEVEKLSGKNCVEEAFAAWTLLSDAVSVSLTGPAKQSLGNVTGAARTYKDVACLGYAVTTDRASDQEKQAFQTSLCWLLKRPAFTSGMPVGFVDDPVALFGVCLGATKLGDASIKADLTRWMTGFIDQSYAAQQPEWKRSLLSIVRKQSKIQPEWPLPPVADVNVVFRNRGLLPTLLGDEKSAEEENALLIIKSEFGEEIEPEKAAIRLAALNWLLESIPTIARQRPTIGEVVELLKGVPAGLRKWTWEEKARTSKSLPRKWYIDHEYHVQNLLYFLLAPIFPELKEEEFTPSVGQKQPRVDLALSSLRLVIEAKFMRKRMSCQDIIEEISADTGLYLTKDSPYDKIIAFIWDDGARTEEHPLLISGLKKLNGIVDAVVVSRPSGMVDTSEAQEEPQPVP